MDMRARTGCPSLFYNVVPVPLKIKTMKKLTYFLALFLLSLSADLQSQKITRNNFEVLLPPSNPDYTAMYRTGLNITVTGTTPEEKALSFIRNEWDKSRQVAIVDKSLKHVITRKMNGSDVVRYRQWFNGLRVGLCEFTVQVNKRGNVSSVVNTTLYIPPNFNITPNIKNAQALEIVMQHFGMRQKPSKKLVELLIIPINEMPVLVYEVRVKNRQLGGWMTFVNASNGDILMATRTSTGVTGTGIVFDPNPTYTAKKEYGEGDFVDNGDDTNPSLNWHLMEVEIDVNQRADGKFYLEGDYAQIVDVDVNTSEEDGLFEQTTTDFSGFTRADRAFEAVNCYYHIDKFLRYIDIEMGVDVGPVGYSGPIHFDPHFSAAGSFGEFFFEIWDTNDDPSDGPDRFYEEILVFRDGEDDVDGGEDAFIINHEAGHAVHYWQTDRNPSFFRGVGEALSDYWGQSMTKGCDLTGVWQEWEDEYHKVFHWGGMPSAEDGQRTTNYQPQPGEEYVPYPTGNPAPSHEYSQHLSTALMRIYSDIGKEKTDLIVLDAMVMVTGAGHGSPNGVSGKRQIDAGRDIYQAAVNLGYSDNDLCIIYRHLDDMVKIGSYSSPITPPTGGSMDIYMKDGTCDNGVEPNTITEFMFHSPDIWVRHAKDGELEHETPEFHPTIPNHVYVRIRSRGCENTGSATLRLYWSKASLGLDWPVAWTNANVPGPGGMVPAGREITAGAPVTINLANAVESGGELIVSIPWLVPNPADYFSVNHHFCLLARLESTNDPISFLEVVPSGENARNNNNITAKNVTIMDKFPNNIIEGPNSVFVGCNGGLINSGIMVESAKHPLGKSIFDYGKVSLKLVGSLTTEWNNGGQSGGDYQIMPDGKNMGNE